jgi:uncharacterized repeat protein (TIGR03803 family)
MLGLFCTATVIASPAQILTTLHSFDGADGEAPYGGLVQASNGNFYGTTSFRGGNGWGTVFKITPSGTLTTLYNFCAQSGCTDGAAPWAGLVQASDGDFYGTTFEGGVDGYGTVFKITLSGTLTTLHSFDGADGASPGFARLLQAGDGNFYGTTERGGANNDCYYGCGTIFKITSSGTLTTLYNFCSQLRCADGAIPDAGLVQASDGNFYGTTEIGGANGSGTVFKITPGGMLITLYSFCSRFGCPDGEGPEAGLVQASNGDFYGTTFYGGAHFEGTVFKITPSGTLTTLYSFCSQTGCVDGSYPAAGLVQTSDGNLYDTTTQGGANNSGTVFKVIPSGIVTTFYSFCSQNGCADGVNPIGELVQASDGNLYGVTVGGGANGDGTVFRLVPLRACVFCPNVE